MELFLKLKIKNAIKQKILGNNSIQISELQTLFLNADHQPLTEFSMLFVSEFSTFHNYRNVIHFFQKNKRQEL